MAGKPRNTSTPRTEPFANLTRRSIGRAEEAVLRAIQDLVHIRRVLPRAVAQLDLNSDPLQASTTDGVGGRSGIPDPTPNGGEYARWAEQRLCIGAGLAEACAAITNLRRAIDGVPTGLDTKAEASRLRCT